MSTEHTTIERPQRVFLGDERLVCTTSTGDRTGELAVFNRAGMRVIAASILYLNNGGTLVNVASAPNRSVPGVRPPAETPDPSFAALVYGAATAPHPDGRSAVVHFAVSDATSDLIRDNLNAAGVDFTPPDKRPDLDLERSRWAETYPRVGVEHAVHTFGEQFVAVGGMANLPGSLSQ